jgi:hypothetical protein
VKKYANPYRKLDATEGMQNERMGSSNNRRRGHDWPDLVGRHNVRIGPCGVGFGRDIAGC